MVMATSETTKTAERAPLGQPSQQGADGSTSKAKPRTYTEEEHKKILTDTLNAARGEEGRKHKVALAAVGQRAKDTAQAQLDKLQAENQELQDDLEQLAADDEDKTRLVKLLKDNQRKSTELEKKISDYEPRIAKAEDWELGELCREVAGEYEGADAARLKRIASRTRFTDDEDKIDQIRSLADDIWAKKTAEGKKEEPRKVDSGVTLGGAKGKTPTIEELAASTPFETAAKIKSGEWIVRGWSP